VRSERLQIAVIEFARSVLGYSDANSGEFDEASAHKVIDFMPDQYGDIPKGGTMRLGAYPCEIRRGSVLEKIYGTCIISERHRHRYEFNNEFREEIIEAGLDIAGTSPDGRLVESVVLPENDFFVGVQYHPEFKSRPDRPHPLFCKFVEVCMKKTDA
jgi:CTP synthase